MLASNGSCFKGEKITNILVTKTYAFLSFHLLTEAILLGFGSSSPHTYTAAGHNVAVIVPGGTHRLFEACTGRYVYGWYCYRMFDVEKSRRRGNTYFVQSEQ